MNLHTPDSPPTKTLRRRLLGWMQDALHAQETGGLSWHWSAYRAREVWRPTQEALEAFLLAQPQKCDELLLIGGSAGWMMSASWLSRFKSITIVDIDPLAPVFFRLLHAKALKKSATAWRFERRDALQELPSLLKEHPKALVFFDNVLGQQCFRLKDEELVERLLGHIKVALKGRTWGSVHDVYSGPIDSAQPRTRPKDPLITPQSLRTFTCRFGPMDSGPLEATHAQNAKRTNAKGTPPSSKESSTEPSSELRPQYMRIDHQKLDFDEGAQVLLQAVNATGEWKDHLSVAVFAPETMSLMIPWFFTPNYCHWLQVAMVFDQDTAQLP